MSLLYVSFESHLPSTFINHLCALCNVQLFTCRLWAIYDELWSLPQLLEARDNSRSSSESVSSILHEYFSSLYKCVYLYKCNHPVVSFEVLIAWVGRERNITRSLSTEPQYWKLIYFHLFAFMFNELRRKYKINFICLRCLVFIYLSNVQPPKSSMYFSRTIKIHPSIIRLGLKNNKTQELRVVRRELKFRSKLRV